MARSCCWSVLAAACVVLALAGPAVADFVNISASKDNTLYQSDAGMTSNGAGVSIVVGQTNLAVDALRRGLIAFDVAGNLPAGATVDSVTLTLQVTMVPITYPGSTVTLHPVSADWGEGESNAGTPAGAGALADTDDATWIYRFYDSASWTNPGGDFGASSASQAVPGPGSFVWSSAQMAADVQSWLDSPAGNFGWAIVGTEGQAGTAMLIASRQSSANVPVLHVEYTVVPEPLTLALLALGAPAALLRRRRR